MKVKIILLIMIVLMPLLFASCAKNEYEEEWEPPKKEEGAQPAAAGEQEPAQQDGIKTIDFILMGYTETGQPLNKQHIQKMLDELNKRLAEEINAEVNFNWAPYETYEESVMKLLASDGGIDVVDIMYPGSDVYNTLAGNDMLRDISRDFKLYMPGTYKLLYEKYALLDEYLLVGGKQHFIPVVNAFPVRDCMMTQKELYLEYGQKVTTLEEYELYMDWLLANKPDLTPGYVNAFDAMETYMEGNGYSILHVSTFYVAMDDPSQTETPMEQLPEFFDAYEMLKRWHDKGFYKNTEGGNYQSAALSGKLASFLVRPYSYTRSETIQLPTDIEYEYVVLYPQTTMILSPDFRGPSILNSSEAAIDVLKFFELIYSQRSYYDLLQYGIEGENYTLTNEKLSAPPRSGETLIDWWGSGNFYNYTMERPTWSEPDDFVGFFEEISFENTITPMQHINKLGIEKPTALDDKKNEETDKLWSDVITPLLDQRFEVHEDFFDRIYSGDFSMTADEAAELLHEGNADELAEAFKQYSDILYQGN